ncbi:MAG: GlsB/YeaQ/YmgE family stress response membrane protein [Verrucomicrobiales bacterium]
MIATLLVGLVIGLLAKWIMPGKDPSDGKGFVGVLITILIGILGSWGGGFIVGLVNLGGNGLIWRIIFGTGGALFLLFLLFLYRKIFAKK